MFVLVDITTMRWRAITWSLEQAGKWQLGMTRVIAEIPSYHADALVDRKLNPSVLFAGMSEYARR